MSRAFTSLGAPPRKRPMKTPSVDFEARDLPDTTDSPNEDSIRRDYHAPHSRVYRANVPVEDMPEWDIIGDVESDNDYDWSELQRGRGRPPPPKIRVSVSGNVELYDGNHRTYFWLNMDRATYSHIPCWIIDDRPTGFFGERRPGDEDDDE